MATAVGSGLADKNLELPDAAGGAGAAELDENEMETASVISGLSAYTVGTQGTGMSDGTLGKAPSTVGGRSPRKSRQKVNLITLLRHARSVGTKFSLHGVHNDNACCKKG